MKTLHKFRTVSEMIEFFGDYSDDNGTFEELSVSPNNVFKLKVVTCDREHPAIQGKMLKGSILYGVYRTFIHVPNCNVVGIISSLSGTDKAAAIGLTVRRSVVLAMAKRIFKVKHLHELVNCDPFPTEGNKTEVLNEFTQAFLSVDTDYHYDFLVRMATADFMKNQELLLPIQQIVAQTTNEIHSNKRRGKKC